MEKKSIYKKILLINPWGGELFPPPSIGYLQGALKTYFKDTIEVYARDLEESISILQYDDFDLVGVTFHSFSVNKAKLIRGLVKKSTKLICGGHHPSSLPEQLLEIGYDQIVIGEGENAIIDILLGNTDKIVFNNNNNYFKCIDDIPFPDYSGLGGAWKNSNSYFGYPIISSRGCPFKCNFCASSKFWGAKIRMRSVDSVINEIIHNIEMYGMINWMFEDDNFTANKKRTHEICDRIINEIFPKYGKRTWQCASRAETLTDIDLCKKLLDAGCERVWIGVESFSQESLNRCKKNTTVEKMVLGIENAESVGLQTMCQFIIGLPGDTIYDIMKTKEVLDNIKISNCGFNIAWILPDTDIYQNAKKLGFNDETYLTESSLYYTYEQNIETLYHWCYLLENK